MYNTPTSLTYTRLDKAYDYFNDKLFDKQLPSCLITMQRKSKAYGYFCGDRFANHENAKEITDEIALNPSYFAECSAESILSTLVHEMVHLWQHHFGKRPTRCYHDRQWSAKMKAVGLHPSDTGEFGGKETGSKMSHYIIENGLFYTACASFIETHGTVFYQDTMTVVTANKSTGRIKFSCDGCGLNAWAKPTAVLFCGECNVMLIPAKS